MKKLIFGLATVLVIIISCDKKDTIPTRFTRNPDNNTNVKFLMLSPDAPSVNFFVNNIKSSAVAASTTGAVQGLVYGNIFPSTIGYTTVPSGSVKIEARVIDSSTVTPGAVILNATENLSANKFYTYVVLDSVKKITTVLVEDDPAVPDPSTSYVRVGNFTSNATSVRVEIRKTTGTTYPFQVVSTHNVGFKSVTAFESLPVATTYRVYLRNPTTNAVMDSIATFTPAASRKYTFYSRGVMGLTGTNTRRPIITFYTNF